MLLINFGQFQQSRRSVPLIRQDWCCFTLHFGRIEDFLESRGLFASQDTYGHFTIHHISAITSKKSTMLKSSVSHK